MFIICNTLLETVVVKNVKCFENISIFGFYLASVAAVLDLFEISASCFASTLQTVYRAMYNTLCSFLFSIHTLVL